ncbi:MAG: zinc-ribbon domain-containing protein [Gemmataceae bacterium]|nr:zinc-ribbon domain-containing protein [Gemmataceae bacterium]
MAEIISCPSCQRKLQVPENLLGQDVQCPTCGAAFAARADQGPAPSQAPAPPPTVAPTPAPEPQRWAPSYPPAGPDRGDYPPGPGPRRPPGRDYGYEDDYDDYDPYNRRPRSRRGMAPHRGSTILTLGILSLVVLGPILGPIAWVMGHQDMNEIRAGRMDPEGEGPTNAGKICGMIATILSAVGLAFCFLWMLVVAGTAGRRL